MMDRLMALLFANRWLPAYILHHKPLILTSYDDDFLKNQAAFVAALPGSEPVFLLLQLGWQHESPPLAEKFARGVLDAMDKMPNLKITVLCNTPCEESILQKLGLDAVFCHQNAFLDESRYPITSGCVKKYDAIYIARITPFKRHLLAAQVPSLLLIGSYSEREKAYAQEILARLAQARHIDKVRSNIIHHYISRSHSGLCLSAEEGAMFVSAEYLLTGIPLVNTANIGGRDQVLPEFAVRHADDTPESVAQMVEYWKNHPLNPVEVRAAFLEKIQIHRRTLREIIADRTGVTNPACPHKLGIRCRLLPHKKFTNGLLRHD